MSRSHLYDPVRSLTSTQSVRRFHRQPGIHIYKIALLLAVIGVVGCPDKADMGPGAGLDAMVLNEMGDGATSELACSPVPQILPTMGDTLFSRTRF